MFVTSNAATILWWARPSSIQAAWNDHILRPWLDAFYRNHMSPTIPKIVLVDKAGSFLASDLAESDPSIVFHLVPILGIWLSIARRADDELMQMIVLPAHDDLEHPMKGKERDLA